MTEIATHTLAKLQRPAKKWQGKAMTFSSVDPIDADIEMRAGFSEIWQGPKLSGREHGLHAEGPGSSHYCL